MKFDPAEVPGYLNAVEQENIMRDAAFLPINESIGPFEVIQLSLERWMILRLAGDPFIMGGIPTPKQLNQFLWVLSPRYNAAGKRRWLHNWKCRRYFGKPEYVKAIIAEARKYLSDSMHDMEGRARGGEFVTAYFSDVGYFCALLGKCNVTRQEVLTMPIRALLQYVRVIRHLEHPEIPMGNPSEKLISDWLEERNVQQRKERDEH